MIRYWPAPSLTAVRIFSISAGLAASTVTPGSTAPDASLTAPAIDACANARFGRIHANARKATIRPVMVMAVPFGGQDEACRIDDKGDSKRVGAASNVQTNGATTRPASYCVTTTVTGSFVFQRPSLPWPRRMKVPGSRNVARTTQRFPSGIGGFTHEGAHGEPPRWSSHTLNCGSKTTNLD